MELDARWTVLSDCLLAFRHLAVGPGATSGQSIIPFERLSHESLVLPHLLVDGLVVYEIRRELVTILCNFYFFVFFAQLNQLLQIL